MATSQPSHEGQQQCNDDTLALLRSNVAANGLCEADLSADGSTMHVLLICKQYLQPLYAQAGFTLIGPSAVVHGQDPWFEMRLEFSQRGD